MAQQQPTGSVSGLSDAQRAQARARAVQAAQVGLAHRAQMTYTEASPARWSGIADRRDSAQEEFPVDSDCSSFVTWCLWNGLHVLFGVGDVVNGENWTGGYTGTMLDHGKQVVELADLEIGDCVLYGQPGTTGDHVTIVVETGPVPTVISHGQPGTPIEEAYNYRPDVMEYRRYI